MRCCDIPLCLVPPEICGKGKSAKKAKCAVSANGFAGKVPANPVAWFLGHDLRTEDAEDTILPNYAGWQEQHWGV